MAKSLLAKHETEIQHFITEKFFQCIEKLYIFTSESNCLELRGPFMFDQNDEEIKAELALLIFAVKSFWIWNKHIPEVFMFQRIINRDSLTRIQT